MNNTLVKIAVPVIGLAVTLVMAFVAYFVIVSWWALPPPVLGFGEGPEQPVHFPHTVHVTAGIDCQFCHRMVSTDEIAGIPAVDQCLFCHQFGTIDGSLAAQERREQAAQEIAKFQAPLGLAEAPIDWMRVHRLPDHVQFVHAPHIQRGISCNECHGNVGEMEVVRQVRALKMADCVDCHREWNAPTDCLACHY